MKKTTLLTDLILHEFSREKQKYFTVIGLFLFGIIAGSLLSSLNNSMKETENYVNTFLSTYSLQGTVKSQVFLISLINYMKFILFLWISGWSVWLIPLCILQVFSKGFRIGYTVACFIQCYQIRGILLSILTILPQSILFLPALFYFGVYQLQFFSERRSLLSGKAPHGNKKAIYGKNAFLFLMFLLLILFCALIEGYVIPTILHPFCTLMR